MHSLYLNLYSNTYGVHLYFNVKFYHFKQYCGFSFKKQIFNPGTDESN